MPTSFLLRPKLAVVVGEHAIEYGTQPFPWVLVRRTVDDVTVLLPPLRDGRIVLGDIVLRVSRRLAGSARIEVRKRH